MRLPLFPSLSGYQRSWLNGDLVAGLTVWAVLVPEALLNAAAHEGTVTRIYPTVRAAVAAVARPRGDAGG
jgi:MFS superfamily sulfate permease-like transporter